MRRAVLTLLVALTLGACQTSTAPDPIPSATGSWSGMGASGFVIFELFLTLSENDSGKLTGTGRLTSPGRQTFEFVVRNGAHGHPDLLVALATDNFVDVNYSGRFVDSDRIEGLINGSGFNNAAVTLNRGGQQ